MRGGTRRVIGSTVFLLSLHASLAGGAAAAAGDLDTSFGIQGWASAPFRSSWTETSAVAIQPDSRILVAGTARHRFALVRYLADGSLDPAFGGDGKVTTAFGAGSFGQILDVAIQTDGKVVAAGVVSRSDPWVERMAVARYLPDGTLDPDFGGGDGVVRVRYGRHAAAQFVHVLDDGTILLGGTGRGSPAFVRLRADGSVSGAFRVDLKDHYVTTGFAVDDRGVVVVGSRFSPPHDFKVARFGLDGTPDPAFGDDGIRRYRALGEDTYTGEIAPDADGKLLVVVNVYDAESGQHLLGLARLLPDGGWDMSFSDDGVAYLPPAGRYDHLGTLALQPDGMIVVGGGRLAGGGSHDQHMLLARFSEDGDLDPSFGDAGVRIQPGPGESGFTLGCSDLALQADERIVAVTADSGGFLAARLMAA